jgi:hypothetical protein
MGEVCVFVIIAVNVTGSFRVEGFFDEVTAVDVWAGFIVPLAVFFVIGP